MQLLLSRSQSPGPVGRIKFDLWAKFELTGEEQALIDKYRVRDAILSEGNTIRDLKRAALYAAGLGFLTVILAMLILGAGLGTAILLGVLAFAALTYAIYNHIREKITVMDIITGRRFGCPSVITLLEKEDTITQMAVAFRRFLEAMKDWGGKEVIDIEPGQAPVLRMIEPPHAAE